MKILEKLNEMLPRNLQDKIMVAYVGRALSFDFGQLYKNIRYGMKADPVVRMIERDNIDWDEVQRDYEEGELRRTPISDIVDEASMDAVISNLQDWEKVRDVRLKQILGEDGPRYAEKLREMAKPEDLYPLPDIKFEDIYSKHFDMSLDPLVDCINMINISPLKGPDPFGYKRPSDSAGSVA